MVSGSKKGEKLIIFCLNIVVINKNFRGEKKKKENKEQKEGFVINSRVMSFQQVIDVTLN